MFDRLTARDLVDALRILDGRLRGSGRGLAPGTLRLLHEAEWSLAVLNGHPVVDGGAADEGGPVELYTFQETAERLRVSEVTVRRLVRDGRLPAVSVGRARRVRPEDLRLFVEQLADKEEAL